MVKCSLIISVFVALTCTSRQLDVVFVLDNSSYVGMADWQVMINFMIDVINKLPAGQNDVRVGMVTFADNARNDVYLDAFDNRQALINALRNAR